MFFGRQPLTVTRFVVAIVVNAVQMPTILGFLAHVGHKVREGIPPTKTDIDASTTVVFEAAMSRVFAALFHAMPRA
jgi:hypothetical protein